MGIIELESSDIVNRIIFGVFSNIPPLALHATRRIPDDNVVVYATNVGTPDTNPS